MRFFAACPGDGPRRAECGPLALNRSSQRNTSALRAVEDGWAGSPGRSLWPRRAAGGGPSRDRRPGPERVSQRASVERARPSRAALAEAVMRKVRRRCRIRAPRTSPVRAGLRQPLAQGSVRDGHCPCRLRHALTGHRPGDDFLSAMDGEAGSLVRAVEPSGPRLEFGDCSLAPKRVSNLLRVHSLATVEQRC
jgi:hypothetical protein